VAVNGPSCMDTTDASQTANENSDIQKTDVLQSANVNPDTKETPEFSLQYTDVGLSDINIDKIDNWFARVNPRNDKNNT
jgi:hypothetical protein